MFLHNYTHDSNSFFCHAPDDIWPRGYTPAEPTTYLHAAAQGYAKQGIKIFPIQPRTKIPYPHSHGYKDATIDMREIDRWFRLEPYSNIACCPANQNQTCLDVDQYKDGYDPANLVALGLPETRENASPRGGRHLWFTGVCRSSGADCFGIGIEVKSLGGYVLLPPSTNQQGRQYTAVNDLAVAPLPAIISDRLEIVEQERRADWRSCWYSGQRLSQEDMVRLLERIDPDCPRAIWWRILAAIAASNLAGDEDGVIREDFGDEWSSGKLWAYGDGQPPETYRSRLDVLKNMSPPRGGGITQSSLFHHAGLHGDFSVKEEPGAAAARLVAQVSGAPAPKKNLGILDWLIAKGYER